MFKKLCVVGIGSCFGSLTPILCWMILGKIHGAEFSNGMSYTYPYQFLFLLTFGIFFRGNIKGELTNSSTDNNKSRTGILLGVYNCDYSICCVIMSTSCYDVSWSNNKYWEVGVCVRHVFNDN